VGLKARVFSLVLLTSAGLALAGPGAAGAACRQWTGAQPSQPGSGNTEIHGVVVPSTCSAWAAGFYRDGGSPIALMEKWNGSVWRQVAIPHSGTSDSLYGASGSWSVGKYVDGFTKTLVLRRVGSGWAPVTSPDPSSADNELMGVAQVSAGNAWAVGWFHNGTTFQTLIVHWNGQKWRRVPSPNAGGSTNVNMLFGVAARSADDVWAVGQSGNVNRALILHWNGKKWRRLPAPVVGDDPFGDGLQGVDVVSARNAWAVGSAYDATPGFLRSMILHWNGSKWRRVPIPNLGNSVLQAVHAFSSRNVWTVGDAGEALVLHWNGRKWRKVAVQSPGPVDNILYAIAGTSPTNFWTVGDYRDPNAVYEPLALHCC
jgi:hypothetical protein